MKNSKDFNNNDSERSEDNTLEQVFILIKKGIQLVDLNRFIEGINYYKNAIKLMKNIGGFENEVEKVEKLLEEASNKQEQYLQKVEQESGVIEKVILTKEEQLAEFERKRKKEKEISAEAYNLLEKGSILIQSNRFDQALEKYMLAIEKFKEINWLTEIPKIHILIKELNEKKEVILRQREAKMKEEMLRKEIVEKKKEFLIQRQDFQKMSAEMKKQKFDIFQQQKKKEEKLSSEAYDLLGEASKLEEQHRFDEALEKYQLAIENFKEISWVSEIPKITQLIKELNEKKEVILRQREAKMKEEKLRKDILEKEKEILLQHQDFQKMSSEMKKTKFNAFQQQKMREEKLSSEAYDLLGEASNLEEKNQFNEALEKYQHAIEKFKEINW
ncbi:MAG: hypothetical protein KAX33_10230, partial [Candidatus Lokiarchaeota archaeon]|nr:hypothetical protein [Candidatus Lokiarchaeota archaeon]